MFPVDPSFPLAVDADTNSLPEQAEPKSMLTDHQGVEQALRVATERLQLATASGNIGTWDLDPVEDRLFWDARCRAAFAYPLDLPIDFPTCMSLIHPDDRAWVLTAVQTALSPEGTGEYALECRTVGYLDNLVRWIRLDGRALFNPEHTQATRFVGTIQDITERKKNEEALHDARTRLDVALTAGEIATWTFDITTNRVVADANLARLFSVDPAAADGGQLGDYLEAVHPEDRAQVVETIQDAVQSKDEYEAEYRVVLPDGSSRWLLARGRVDRDAEGNAVALPGVVIDATGRKQAEIALKVSLDSLREREEFLRRIVENSPDCIKTLDLAGNLVAMNEGGQASMDVDDFASICGVRWLTFWQNETHGEVQAAIAKAKAGGTGRFHGYCPTMKGTGKWWDVVVVPILGVDGKPEQLLSVSRDITIQHEMQLRQQFLSDLTERTRQLLDPESIVQETVSAVGKFLGLSRFVYAEIHSDAGYLTIPSDWHDGSAGMESLVGRWSFAEWDRNVATWGGMFEELNAGEVLVVNDFSTDPRTADLDAASYHPSKVRAAVRIPLLREGKWVGMFSAQSATPRVWTTEEVALLESVAQRSWLTLENARLFKEATKRAEREALVNAVGTAIYNNPGNIEAILQATVSALGQGVNADRCYFVRYDTAKDTAVVGPEWYNAGLDPLLGRVFQMSKYAVDRDPNYRAGRTHVVEDIAKYDPEDAKALQELGIRALLRVPLQVDNRMAALGVAMTDTARSWTDDEIRVLETVASQIQSALNTALLRQRERNIATQLQDALQPLTPPSLPGMALGSFYRPALKEASVGGDFFDVFALEKGCSALVVADLSGKGLTAASQVATVRNMLRYATYTASTLASALKTLNDVLAEQNLLTGFATLFIGAYDHAQRTLTYVNCGQEPGLVWRRETGNVELLAPTGPVLGGFSGGNFVEKVVSLQAGDVLALFTDGLTEVGPSRKNLLEVEGVMNILQQCANDSCPDPDTEFIVSRLIAGVDTFAEGGVRDDIALLVGVVQPVGGETRSGTISTRPRSNQ